MKSFVRSLSKFIAPALIVGAVYTPAPLSAKIDLVTLPERDESELTIYNSQDLTLVRETRTLSFSKGVNEIQFSWANTLIDPTSLQIELGGNADLSVLDAVYPANTSQLIVWNIEAEAETSAQIEISYFTSGLSWEADYIVKANAEETEFSLQQFTTVRNSSGEDFDNAVTRVVVGEVNLVELIRTLAERGIVVDESRLRRDLSQAVLISRMAEVDAVTESAFAAAPMAMRKEAKAIIKKAVSEYYLFAVEGKETIENGWGKELPNPIVENIPFDLSYEINPQKYGNQVVKFYKLKNSEDHELGKEPLPDGRYYVYSDDGRDGLRFEGSTSHKYIPRGEDIELNLGTDGLVLYEARTMEYSRTNFDFTNDGNIAGWDEVRTIQLEIKNSRNREIPVKLWHYIEGDWEFDNVSDQDYEQVDQRTVKWEFDVDPQSTKIIEYTSTTRLGSRAKR